MKWYKHLRTINHHKWIVMKLCFRCGLYKQGLLHDLSKYSWTEFSVGAKYYQGNRSPNSAEREDKGYTSAWLHHKGRNKHHLEYWIDYSLNPDEGIAGMEMPKQYVVEMFCDRVAACMNYNPDGYRDDAPLIYYEKGKHKYPMNQNSRALLEDMLMHLAKHGLDAAIEHIRKDILKNKK